MSNPSIKFRQVLPVILAQRRQALSLTTADVASALKVSNAAVNQWEKGKAYPRAYRLAPLAELLEITVRQLEGKAPLPAEKLIESSFDAPRFAGQLENLISSAETALGTLRTHPAVRRAKRSRSKAKTGPKRQRRPETTVQPRDAT